MKKFKFKIDDENFDVSVSEKGNNIAEVIVNGKTYSVQVEKEETPAIRTPVIKTVQPPAPKTSLVTAPQPAAAPVKKQGGAEAIRSPLPGNIFKIVVEVGQSVKKGDLLLVIESMKMENNILSDREGCVKVIYVQPGQNILQNDLLIELE